jgi:hypothetical protein
MKMESYEREAVENLAEAERLRLYNDMARRCSKTITTHQLSRDKYLSRTSLAEQTSCSELHIKSCCSAVSSSELLLLRLRLNATVSQVL